MMGIGWEYFNNVCRAMRIAARLLGGVIGLIVVVLVGGSVMQYINANRADQTLIVAPTATPAAAPSVKANPQFMPPNTPGMPASGNTATSPAGTPASNPQFGQPRPLAPANTGTRAGATGALPDTKPNPQFSKP